MAGSYQPEAMQQLAKIDTPAFVAVVGKPNLYQTPDGAFLVSVRVESITIVDKETRDLWVLDTAARTLDRIDVYTTGAEPDVVKAKEQYPWYRCQCVPKDGIRCIGPDQDMILF